MATKLIYWQHSRMRWTKEEYKMICQRSLRPITDKEAEEFVEEKNKIFRMPFFYTEEQFSKLENKPERKELYEFTLGKHLMEEEIPTFEGFTPRFCLKDARLKEESEIDLLEEFSEYLDLKEERGKFSMNIENKGSLTKCIKGENLNKARANAGTNEAYESKRKNIEEEFSRLNNEGIEFLVFRTFRKFPATWDNISFYSQGKFNLD